MFMIRQGRWKYIHYPGFAPQLFDLWSDPQERHDLGQDPSFAAVRQRLDTVLRSQCDPEAVNAGAFADQAARIAANGGRAEIAASADIPFTPAPA